MELKETIEVYIHPQGIRNVCTDVQTSQNSKYILVSTEWFTTD